MARSSTPLSCLTFHSLLFGALAGDHHLCAGCNADASPGNPSLLESEEHHGLELLQMKSKKVAPWQCHEYEGEQNDEWCMTAGTVGDYEFSFNHGISSPCGNCWCCKRSTAEKSESAVSPEEFIEKVLTSSKEAPRQEGEESVPVSEAWTCHTYTADQNDDWCQSAGTQGGFEYSFSGGKSDQCGDCWCCKKEVQNVKPTAGATGNEDESGHVQMPDEEKPASIMAEQAVEDTKAVSKSASWVCHKYESDQNDDWCASAGTQGGFEYEFNAGKSQPCGDCWCCKREVQDAEADKDESSEPGQDKSGDTEKSKPKKSKGEKLPYSKVIKPPNWECHTYTEGQNDDWCKKTKAFGDYELAFTSGKDDLCGKCQCCKRSMSSALMEHADADENQTPTSKEEADQNSSESESKSDSWMCHKYSAGQNDDWCMSAGTQGGFEYIFNAGKTAEYQGCGDCWCCKKETGSQIAEPTQSASSHKDEPGPTEVHAEVFEHEEQENLGNIGSVAGWECHDYEQGQDDSWCESTKEFLEYEYSYTGGENALCGACFCCKRKIIQ